MKIFRNFFKLIHRELKLFTSNSVAVAIFIGAPLLFGILTGFVYSDASVSNLPVTILDLDDSSLSNDVIDALDDNEYLRVENIRKNVVESADDFKSGKIHAVITIPAGFEADINQKRHPEVQVDINAVNILTANYTARGIQHVLATINAGIEIKSLNKAGMPESLAKERYEAFFVNMDRFFNPAANYLQFLWPGVLATIMQQVFLLIMALTFSKEFEEGKFQELVSYNNNPLVLMTVKSLPYWIMGILLWGIIINIFFPYFHVPAITPVYSFFWLSLLFILSLTTLGTFVSLLIPNQLKATEVLMIIATPSFIISGFTWPLSQMPAWVRVVADFIPLTHFLSALRKLMVGSTSFYDLFPEIKALFIISLVSGLFAVAMLYLKIRKLNKQLKF